MKLGTGHGYASTAQINSSSVMQHIAILHFLLIGFLATGLRPILDKIPHLFLPFSHIHYNCNTFTVQFCTFMQPIKWQQNSVWYHANTTNIRMQEKVWGLWMLVQEWLVRDFQKLLGLIAWYFRTQQSLEFPQNDMRKNECVRIEPPTGHKMCSFWS